MSAYVLGACYAQPGGDQWHDATCDTCEEARGYLADPVLAAEFRKGKAEQESFLRMPRHRREYHRKRRYW